MVGDGKIYALYHGETNLMDGTLAEIAARRNCTMDTLRFMLRPVYKRRVEKASRLRLELVEIEDD